MSNTNIFQCRDQMVSASGDQVVRATSDPDENRKHGGLPLPGYRRTSNDVVSVRTRPQATGRRP